MKKESNKKKSINEKKTERQGTDHVSNMQVGYVHMSADAQMKTFEKQNQWFFYRNKTKNAIKKKKGIFRSAGAVLRTASQT